MEPGNELEQERARQIAELESRLERPSGVGVMPPLAAVVLLASLYLCTRQWADVEYFSADATPVELGVEGDYHFDRLRSNSYVQLHGSPTVRASYGLDGEGTVVVVGVRETPLLLARPALQSERWVAGKPPPPPDPRSFSVRGRLLARADAPRWSDAFAKHAEFGEVKPEWIVLEGERPHQNFGAMAWFGVLSAFAALNAWMLVRGMRSMLRRRRA